ncbi:beta-1,6-N-acetylglucosaminyltransferase [Chlorogloeopsis sp. ULAP01]|uniref:beta-1,6-N-acetylglucosaminyltransferase n=1 Tax=Chlorogloeopsis sp. ULAP01 TaxID=3056483 RepID=UPI0025AAEBC8|nr:beta-1,6-N-acetylglucosaminyltransferase [Chlorogloeopsis sp. ULAP01]MDM9382433.1 beta-1,6-N-acetylglucosaminyltransferase [Chlorogloeopsis sp. ULAP01]
MKIVYLIQTHKNPEQIYRLVNIIKESSPKSYILISHNPYFCKLDKETFGNLTNFEIINNQGGRGDFSLIKGYLDAVHWLFSHNIKFDWLINLTGQDYPTQPLPKIEKFLAETEYDAFLFHFNALSDCEKNCWGSKEGRDRYLYQYRKLAESLPPWQEGLIKFSRRIINNIQPYIRVHTSYGITAGIRANFTPFNEYFACYGGSYFHTLSLKCIQYLYYFCNQNPELITYYQKTCLPDESFIQTILINSELFNICNDNKRYIDFTNSRQGHPRILTVNHYSHLISDEIHFARKFDMSVDSKILDMLDARILQTIAAKEEGLVR